MRSRVTPIAGTAKILIKILQVIHAGRQNLCDLLDYHLFDPFIRRTHVIADPLGLWPTAHAIFRRLALRIPDHDIDQPFFFELPAHVIRRIRVTPDGVPRTAGIQAYEMTFLVQRRNESVEIGFIPVWRPYIWRGPRGGTLPVHQQGHHGTVQFSRQPEKMGQCVGVRVVFVRGHVPQVLCAPNRISDDHGRLGIPGGYRRILFEPGGERAYRNARATAGKFLPHRTSPRGIRPERLHRAVRIPVPERPR